MHTSAYNNGEKFYNKYLQGNFENKKVLDISSVMNFFTELEMPVSHFSKSIDEDFCYGAFSHNLITTTGGFSELMKKISNAQPPDSLGTNSENKK